MSNIALQRLITADKAQKQHVSRRVKEKQQREKEKKRKKVQILAE
jgi:hypothetical protein